jgi:hypothetical protein
MRQGSRLSASESAADANLPPSPVFLVGADRSGTTLLRLMLDRHSRLAIPPESHFIPLLWRRRDKYGSHGFVDRQERFLADLAGYPTYVSWGIPIEAVEQQFERLQHRPSFAEAIDAIFTAWATLQGKPRWGDKTPSYVREIPLLNTLFPESRFIHLIRDGRDVALSVIDLRRLPHNAPSAGFYWQRGVRAGRSAGLQLGLDRYREVHYEDLASRPEESLREIASYLGLAFEREMLEQDDDALGRIPERYRVRHSRLSLPVTASLRDWRTEMSAADVADIEVVAGECLSRHGYAVSDAPRAPTASLRAWARVGWFFIASAKGRARFFFRSRSRHFFGSRSRHQELTRDHRLLRPKKGDGGV